MAQDQISGAAANEWGRVTARAIASKIGAIMKGQTSNEALLEGKTVVIKCAASATDSVGVTFKMLDRLDSIIGAFQLDDARLSRRKGWHSSKTVFRTERKTSRKN
jgi:hypothetical protein